MADHLLWSNPHGANRWQALLLSLHGAGWIGVDLFFVLSGFLITGILYDSLPSPHYFRNFYARRALRIFPLYYAVLLLLIVAGWLAGAHWNAGVFRWLTYTQNLAWRGMPLPTDAWWININHFWSLAIEEQFYLVWPTLLFVLRSRKRIAWAAAAGIAVSLGLRLVLWHSIAEQVNPYLLYVWTPARLDGLLAGALLAMAVRTRQKGWYVRFCRPAGWAALALVAALDVRYPGLPIPLFPTLMVWAPTLLAIVFSALLLDALQPDSRSSRILRWPGLRFFGRYSYGLYVLHPMVGVFTLVPLRVWLRAQGASRGVSVMGSAAATLLVTVASAWCSFRFFEAPLLRWKARFQDDSPRPKLRHILQQRELANTAPELPSKV